MSLNNQLLLLFLYSFIFLEIFLTVKAQVITDEKDCSEIERINTNLLIKIEELENRIKELELENEQLRKYKKEEENKKEEEDGPTKKETKLYRNIDSKIIENIDEFHLLYQRLKKNNEVLDFKLLYRKSVDGTGASDFHNKCDGIGKTIAIIKSKTGYKFGGYAESKWTSNAFTWVYNDFNSFVFSLNLMKIYNSTTTPNEKYHLGKYSAPQFWAFTLADDTNDNPSYLKPFGETLQYIYHDGNKHFSGLPSNYEINGGSRFFYPQEVEVFQIIYDEEE